MSGNVDLNSYWRSGSPHGLDDAPEHVVPAMDDATLRLARLPSGRVRGRDQLRRYRRWREYHERLLVFCALVLVIGASAALVATVA